MPEPATLTTHELGLRGWRAVAGLIDHSLVLRPETTGEQVTKLCDEAVQYSFAAAFVPPTFVALAAHLLHVTGVNVGTPVGFPQGSSLTTVKRFEATEAIRLGAHELDMVLNIGALKEGRHTQVQSDIHGVVEVAHAAGAAV